jgi:hypothetical protein
VKPGLMMTITSQSKRGKGTMTDEVTTTKQKVVIQYAIDGVPITNPSVNSLSGVAYFHTKGVEAGTDRITTKQLVEALSKAGIENPKTTAFTFPLGNGKTLTATVGALAEKVARVKKADQPDAVAKKLVAKARLERQTLAKTEAAALSAWRKGGEVGPKPETPNLDALGVSLARKETKAAAKAPAKKAAVKPTKRNGKTVAKKAPVAKVAATTRPAAPAATGGKVFRGSFPKVAAKKATA